MNIPRLKIEKDSLNQNFPASCKGVRVRLNDVLTENKSFRVIRTQNYGFKSCKQAQNQSTMP